MAQSNIAKARKLTTKKNADDDTLGVYVAKFKEHDTDDGDPIAAEAWARALVRAVGNKPAPSPEPETDRVTTVTASGNSTTPPTE